MTLPKLPFRPEKSSYRYTPNSEVVVVQLDGGSSRRRKDIAEASSIVECTFFLYADEFQFFTAFYQFNLARGAKPFLLDMLLEQPYLEEKQCAFLEDTFESRQIGLSFEVTCQLEVVSTQDDDFAEMIIELYNQDDDYLNVLEELVNVYLEIA